MEKFWNLILKILEIILIFPLVFLAGCIIALFVPFALTIEIVDDILYN